MEYIILLYLTQDLVLVVTLVGDVIILNAFRTATDAIRKWIVMMEAMKETVVIQCSTLY